MNQLASEVQQNGDIFETDFELPQMGADESGSEVLQVDSANTDLEDSDFDLAIEPADCPADDESASQMVLMEEEPLAVDEKPVTLDDVVADEDMSTAMGRTQRGPVRTEVVEKVPAKQVVRKATVRYYERMNPERVYPLLVMITRDAIQEVAKKHVFQRASGPFAVAADLPIEVEPVAPGCDCYPTRMSTRLQEGELTATFRLVPRVLGRVDGMRVLIRQDHRTLAEVELDAKVVKKTWAVLSGLSAVALPGVSAVLKHFRLDFASQQEQSFNVYIAAAHVLFDWMPPTALLIALTAVAGMFWWLTRPKLKDVFWEVKKGDPELRLERIRQLFESDPDKAKAELKQLLADCSDHLPALGSSGMVIYRRPSGLATT